jgi:hypothetical protein
MKSKSPPCPAKRRRDKDGAPAASIWNQNFNFAGNRNLDGLFFVSFCVG